MIVIFLEVTAGSADLFLLDFYGPVDIGNEYKFWSPLL